MSRNVREPLLRVFHENPGMQLTIGEVKDRVNAKGHDFTRAQISGALGNAEKVDLIDRAGQGIYVYRPVRDTSGTLYEHLTTLPEGETLVKSEGGDIFVVVPVADYFKKG